jgi:hypothetical protein
MKRAFDYKQPPSTRRPLKIYAFDPMLGRRSAGRITIDIPNEGTLQPGPRGERIEVIDYDGVNRCFYAPVNLNDEAILMQDGLEPTESDPRFHQQMVYAVAMKVLENFDTALGRKLYFYRKKPLRILPHAFQGANAFYEPNPKLRALMFGYFRADDINPGPNLPGQTVFTCLSHDIIAHEMTHAIVDRLRHYFIEPSNRDVAAFHEGFSDIVAIFQHFSFPAILRDHIQETRSDLRSPNNLINLASEFGYATGQGEALRSAVDNKDGKPPDATLYQSIYEPHERGSILVAAVFDAFFKTYQNRIKDLVRIATGGTGKLPDGDLLPDLVNRIASEASRTAQNILNMCIRAFEYLPPVDVTFGDYLRALVTADFELSPNDEVGQRAAMIEAFRVRGVCPENVTSLAEDSLLWESYEPDELPKLPIINEKSFILREILKNAYNFSQNPGTDERPFDQQEVRDTLELSRKAVNPTTDDFESDLSGRVIAGLRNYATNKEVARKLHLDPARPIAVLGFHPVFRVAPRGQLLVEMVVQFAQQDRSYEQDAARSGGLPLRGGTTLIAAANGDVRYVISKPLESTAISGTKQREAKFRRQRQEDFVHECDSRDPHLAWCDDKYYRQRVALSVNFKAIHSEVRK